MVARVFLALIFLIVAAQVSHAAASLEARVDRTVIDEGETLVLELIQRGGDNEPDVSPLLLNFEVLSSGRNSQMSIVNGKIDSYTAWRYTLSPLRSGALIIPALSSGSVRSKPIGIKVNPTDSATAGGGGKEIFLEVGVDDQNPYVQAQVIYTVRIFRSRDFFDASLSEPRSDDYVFQRLGEDTSYKLLRDGIRYTVIQRRYVLFVQKSGAVAVPSLVLNATIAAKNSTMGSFGGLTSRRRPVRLRSEEIKLDVRSAPQSYSGAWWLPARSLEATETWSESIDELRVGSPITRTISMRAEGVLRGQLPKLSMPRITGLKIYSDQPELKEETTADGLVGRHTERWAIIPSRAGEYQVPEQRITWWDVDADRQKFTVLPARTVVVLPAVGADETGGDSETPVPQPLADESKSGLTIDENPPMDVAPVKAGFSWWPLLVAFLLVGWSATTLFLVRKLRDEPDSKESAQVGIARRSEVLKQLKQACSSGDLLAIKQAVLRWSAVAWPDAPPLNLVELASRLDDRGLSELLRAIDAAIYSGNQAFDMADLTTLTAGLAGSHKKYSARVQAQDLPLPEL